jgi:formylglycine-generating enzyme required for sulfatase activity
MILFLAITITALYAQSKPRLAVAAFTVNPEKIQQQAATVRAIVESAMIESQKYQIFVRDDIDKLMAEQQIQLSHIASPENVQKLKMENIKYLVTGTVNLNETDYVVVIRVFDVSNGEYVQSVRNIVAGSSKGFYEGTEALVQQLIKKMPYQGDKLIQTEAPPSRTTVDLSSFVAIHPGSFLMGSPGNELGRENNESQRRVSNLQGFHISKYEVTQKDYESVMKNNPSRYKGDNHPVENITFYEAINYCNKRSEQEGLMPVYTGNGTNINWNRQANGYRLPTEEEWEYACRAGTTTPFFTGNNITTKEANYDGNYPYGSNPKGGFRESTWPVGSGKQNNFGLFDMSGNVWEWCWTSDGANRVIRGGSWYNNAEAVRSAKRQSLDPNHRSDKTGFRIVLQQQEP